MIGKTIFSFILVLGGLCSKAQDIHIRGYVKDASTGHKLLAVNIQHLQTMTGTTTDDDGYYKLIVPAGTGDLVFSYIGYKKDTVQWSATSDTVIHVMLSDAV